MIIEWLVGGLVGGLGGVLHLALGAAGTMVQTVPGAVSLSGGVVVGWSFLNTFLPLTEVGLGIGFLLVVYMLLFGFRVVLTVWGQIPIIGGHG
jgi:hypothetical protein